MYGYIKQPDGVLKPIQLDGIKNIVPTQNSLDIIYFQVGSTPLEIPRVDQEYAYNNGGAIKTCVVSGGMASNDFYTLSTTDFVNGDKKITFGDTNLNLLEVI